MIGILMHTFSSPVKEDAITSLTRSVFPREISFPTKVPSPTKSCIPQWSFYLQDICFPSGVIARYLFSPVDHLLLPSVVMLYYHHMHSLTLHCILGSKIVFYIFKSLQYYQNEDFQSSYLQIEET